MNYEERFTEEAIYKLGASGLPVPAKEDMTCNKCENVNDCRFAWDLYNTDGDCLASK